MGRKQVLKDDEVLCISGITVWSGLHPRSQRRAIIAFLMDEGGRATVGEIATAFPFEVRSVLAALYRKGWLVAKAGERPSRLKPRSKDDTVLCVSGVFSEWLLPTNSLHRSVVQVLIEGGGRATVSEINDAFRFNTRDALKDLVKAGWLVEKRSGH